MATPSGIEHAIAELHKHPAALFAAFEAAREQVDEVVGDTPLVRWAEEGARVAAQGPRAWEAATEYFRASPQVLRDHRLPSVRAVDRERHRLGAGVARRGGLVLPG